jgi:preprotein translocase subunit SecA
LRRQIVLGEELKKLIWDKVEKQIENLVGLYTADGIVGSEKEKIIQEFVSIIPFDPNSQKQLEKQLEQLKSQNDISSFLFKVANDAYTYKEKTLGAEIMRQIEKWVCLSVVDNLWMDHLDSIDDLREGIGLRGYGQLDPLVEYKNEAYSMFERLVSAVDYEIAHRIFKVQVQLAPDQLQALQRQQQTAISETAKEQLSDQAIKQSASKKKLGRNDPCWCGATKPDGTPKKYKHCHYPDMP